MASTTAAIRLSNLLRPDLTAPRKLVCLALQIDQDLPHSKLYSPTRIEKRVGVSRPTSRSTIMESFRTPIRPQLPVGLERLARKKVRVNVNLITDKTIPAMARVIYCVLLGLKRINKLKSYASYRALGELLCVQARTVSRALEQLVDAGWLTIERPTERTPITFDFPEPEAARQRAEVRRAQQRLGKSKYHGEALALLWCDALVDSNNYRDDHFPASFTNLLTNERLQADRFYFHGKGVAIEFNGPQHEGPTARYSEAEAKAQIARDRMKQQICARQKIPLITIRPEDLTLARMRELLGQALPLRDTEPDDLFIEYLEYRSMIYLERIRHIRGQVR